MDKTTSTLSRRTALAALGMGAAASLAPAARAATRADKASLESAVERLRVAMVAGDATALKAMLHDRLTYMHSSGHSQTKAMLMDDLTVKRMFAGLTYSGQTVDVIGHTGTVVQTVDQVKNLPDGATRASRIKVLQTWLHAEGAWKLLSRVSAIIYSPLTAPACPPPDAKST